MGEITRYHVKPFILSRFAIQITTQYPWHLYLNMKRKMIRFVIHSDRRFGNSRWNFHYTDLRCIYHLYFIIMRIAERLYCFICHKFRNNYKKAKYHKRKLYSLMENILSLEFPDSYDYYDEEYAFFTHWEYTHEEFPLRSGTLGDLKHLSRLIVFMTRDLLETRISNEQQLVDYFMKFNDHMIEWAKQCESLYLMLIIDENHNFEGTLWHNPSYTRTIMKNTMREVRRNIKQVEDCIYQPFSTTNVYHYMLQFKYE